ncbi:MAG: hypothetical protein H7Y07_11180 [Pyrinomonadaceae bacterium]|nr:hypothetical protein [Sphingobacteriaceae bacterium]
MKKQLSKILSCLLVFMLCFSATWAQIKTLAVKKDFFKGSADMKSLRLNENSLAFMSNLNNKSVEIVGTDNNANKKWSATVEGYLQETVLLGNNLLVLVSTDFTFFTRANSTYKAYLISTDKGTILKEKVLFNGNNEYFTLPYLLVSKDKNTLTLATRETAMKRNIKIGAGTLAAVYTMKKMSDQSNKVKAFNVLTFDKDLNERGAISPELPEGEFIGIQKTINNDMYIAVSENKKGITISKYLPDSENAVKSLTEPYSYYSGLLGLAYLNEAITFYADTLTDNTVYICGSFKSNDDYITMLNKYDFSGDQHKRFKKTFTKAEVKGMEKAYKPLNKDKEFKDLHLAPAKSLELINLVIHENGYIMILSDNQINSNVSGPAMRISEGIILYNLDHNMAIRTISTIPRGFNTAIASTMNVFVKDENLYILASYSNHANFITARVNCNSGKLEDLQLIEPDKANSTDHADLAHAIFNDKNFIIPVLDAKMGIGKIKNDIQLYQFSW